MTRLPARAWTRFPRLFTVTDITINGGPVATGGRTINPATAGYTLDLTGNIYYSSGQQNVCAATTTADVQLSTGVAQTPVVSPLRESCSEP